MIEVVKSLLSAAQTCTPPLCSEEIGIMAPWREQVRLLREELRKSDLHAVDVGTVEVRMRSLFLYDSSWGFND